MEISFINYLKKQATTSKKPTNSFFFLLGCNLPNAKALFAQKILVSSCDPIENSFEASSRQIDGSSNISNKQMHSCISPKSREYVVALQVSVLEKDNTMVVCKQYIQLFTGRIYQKEWTSTKDDICPSVIH